jgi:hypothetical protein
MLVTLPYAWFYLQTAEAVGVRDMRDVVRYSARPLNYLAASSMSRLWSWTADRWGAPELRLYPGVVVVALALAGLLHRSRRLVILYAASTAVAIELSFGVNGAIYHWLFDRVLLLQGLRSSARIAIIASCTLAMLAAFGAQAIRSRSRRLGPIIVPIFLALMTIDFSNRSPALIGIQIMRPASVYRAINSAGPGVVIELPFPTLNALPGRDPFYSLWSLQHWQPLVNGYSGYYPPDYVQTAIRMESFPDDGSLARLKAHDVRYIVVHRHLMDEARYTSLMLRMAARQEIRPWGMYRDPQGDAALFVLER